ncbi:phosphate acyltransferase [Pseudohongiella spirulinae]|uniref:Phosphate acyltransferase n=2 Tax=Pseudohongiella spirulinae TaxID=1249552 RepID=A0A0S2KDI0_9GAMM|nr:phosphate acyltransferase [Pseudohongiella spirulinae]
MGGDYGPPVTIPAAIDALGRHAELHLLLAGRHSEIEPYLEQLSDELRQRVTVVDAQQIISNHDRPDSILRSFRDSSMFRAVDLVRQGMADASVSAGNTGALLLAGRHLLKTIPGIAKPAIMAIIPATRPGGYSYLLDVGANISSTARELYQFARMGAVVAQSLSGRPQARVALLNIGAEEIKGTAQIKEAATLLQSCRDINFTGYIEGNQIFDGAADVIVCDGFTGNVTIKTSAGAVKAMQRLMHQSMQRRWYYQLFGWIFKPFFSDLQKNLRPSRYNGAALVGLQGIIVKSHGDADQQGFVHAIEHALKQTRDNVPAMIASRMASASDLTDPSI